MAGRFGTVALAVFVLSVSVVASRRAILSEANGAQFELGDVQGMHRHLMTSLKAAQEKAGIFVDDAHLFEQPISAHGRKLQQTDASAAVLTNPVALATIMSLIGSGATVGTFPGVGLNLPGGSAFGYSPSDDSYCLFATQPYSGPTASPAKALSPLPAGGLPDTFGCVAASAAPPATPDSFTVDVNGQTFVCQGTASPAGRKLLQAPGPVDAAIGNALAAIGLPIWNCVVSTTPAGNTTLGAAALAVLNDLGVVAEHLLVYLNANGELTYEENIVNDFVSLTNPLYPTGPRLNFSIDFSVVDKDKALKEEIFGKPAPVSPPPATPVTPDSPPTPPTPDSTSPPSPPGSSDASTGTQTTTSDSPTPTTTAAPDTPPAETTTVTAFDGYVDNCQVVIGSVPHSDGNFDRNNNFTAVIAGGETTMTVDTTNSFAGQVIYVIPASKATEYPELTADTRSTAQFCNDIATFQPVYNPLASLISANATDISANPLTTVASFGQPYGLTPDALTTAMAVQMPDGETLWSYDALADAANGSTAGITTLKANVQVANLVTAGANLLTNDSAVYASFAIIMNQAIARKVLYSPPSGRKLLQAPAVDLTNATTVTDIMNIAQQMVPSQSDANTVAALTQNLTPDQTTAVGQAVANLNAAVAASTDADSIEKGRYYAETELASQVNDLATGQTSVADFNTATSTSAISDALTKTTLPGTVTPQAATPPPTPAPTAVPQTQSSTSGSTNSSPQSSSSGLSHGGKVALATVLPIVGVAALVAVAAFLITRRNRGTYEESNNSAVWWRRPFARSGPTPGPSTV